MEKVAKRSWRSALIDREPDEVSALEVELRVLAKNRAQLRGRLTIIRERAWKRLERIAKREAKLG